MLTLLNIILKFTASTMNLSSAVAFNCDWIQAYSVNYLDGCFDVSMIAPQKSIFLPWTLTIVLFIWKKEGISICISGAGMMMLEKRSFIQSLQMEYLPVVSMDANAWIVLHRMRNERKKNNPKMYVPKIKTTTISR